MTFPRSFILAFASSKICFYLSSSEAAKTRDNGAGRGSVRETEKLDHICTVLVTTLTLRQSPHKSKMVPLGRPAWCCWHILFLSSPHLIELQRYCVWSSTRTSARAPAYLDQCAGSRLGIEYSRVHPPLRPELTHQRSANICGRALG